MENTKKGNIATKALMMGTALVSLNALAAAEAQAASGTGAMSAVILTPIVVSGTETLHFGDVTEASSGTVVMDTADGQTVTGGVTGINNTNTPNSGVIQIQAATGAAISLSMAATSYNVTHTTVPTQQMVVNGFNIGTAAAGSAITVTLAAATETRPLGATLNVTSPQTPGTYTGAYTVNANYQ